MTRLLLLAALAAALSGCVADAYGYLSADQCWEDRECRREWRREEREEQRQERVQRRHRYAQHAQKRERRDRDELHPIRAGKKAGPLCGANVSATGERAQSEEAARGKALTSWQGQVAFLYGEAYTSFHNARHQRVLCTPAGLADTVTGKIQQKWLGITHWRCQLEGTPCRERARPVGEDD